MLWSAEESSLTLTSVVHHNACNYHFKAVQVLLTTLNVILFFLRLVVIHTLCIFVIPSLFWFYETKTLLCNK